MLNNLTEKETMVLLAACILCPPLIAIFSLIYGLMALCNKVMGATDKPKGKHEVAIVFGTIAFLTVSSIAFLTYDTYTRPPSQWDIKEWGKNPQAYEQQIKLEKEAYKSRWYVRLLS